MITQEAIDNAIMAALRRAAYGDHLPVWGAVATPAYLYYCKRCGWVGKGHAHGR